MDRGPLRGGVDSAARHRHRESPWRGAKTDQRARTAKPAHLCRGPCWRRALAPTCLGAVLAAGRRGRMHARPIGTPSTPELESTRSALGLNVCGDDRRIAPRSSGIVRHCTVRYLYALPGGLSQSDTSLGCGIDVGGGAHGAMEAAVPPGVGRRTMLRSIFSISVSVVAHHGIRVWTISDGG